MKYCKSIYKYIIKMYDLYHETSYNNLSQILIANELFKSSNLPDDAQLCQGSSKRKLCKNPNISLENPDFWKEYDEVDAVYLRLKEHGKTDILKYNDCALIFNSKLLSLYNNVINTEENFGFMINKNGVLGQSQFSGETGMSIYNMIDIEKLTSFQFDYNNSEVAVLSNIDLKFLNEIIIKKKYIKFNKKLLDNSKLPKLKISYI